VFRFWSAVIRPLFDIVTPKVIVEIGSANGSNTKNIILYALESGATVHVIDTVFQYDYQQLENDFPGVVKFYNEKSLTALPQIGSMDAILIDGDHNWYTVYNELLQIGNYAEQSGRPFPLALLHDVHWPYARRDLYYDVDNIPAEFRHPYKRMGIPQDSGELSEDAILNSHLCNAVHEGGPQNGVLTAVEHYISNTHFELQHVVIPAIYGLGVVYPKGLMSNAEFSNFIKEMQFTGLQRNLLTSIENARVSDFLDSIKITRRKEHELEKFKHRVQTLQDKFSHQEQKERELQDRLSHQEQKERELQDRLSRQEQKERELQDQLSHQEQKEQVLRERLSLQNETELVVKERLSLQGQKEQVLRDRLSLQEAKERELKDHLSLQEAKERELKDHLSLQEAKERELKDLLSLQEAQERELKDHLSLQEAKERELKDRLLRQEKTHKELKASKADCSARLDAMKKRLHKSELAANDNLKLRTWLRHLDRDVLDTLNSARWRLGNRLVRIVEQILFRPKRPLATDNMLSVLEQYRSWLDTSLANAQNHSSQPCSNAPLATPKAVARATPISRRPVFLPQIHASQLLCTNESPTRDRFMVPGISNAAPLVQSLLSSTNVISNASFSNDPVAVVIPVFNAFNDLQACIESILCYTRRPHLIIIVDDCSTDPSVAQYLQELHSDPRFRIIRNECNKGFVATANIGMQATSHDVVLLNSDTQVTPRWLSKLRIAAYHSPDIATATPFSNAAGAFSVPELGVNSPIPTHMTLTGMSRVVERLALPLYPAVPTGNGFCMYIKRAALEDVGFFDEQSFGRGYGEENDFCMRLIRKGWRHVIDDATFVYHRGNASFGEEKILLSSQNRAILDQKYPEYTSLVRDFVNSSEINTARAKIGSEIGVGEKLTSYRKRRILYVLHQGGGGVPHANADTVRHVSDWSECFLLTSDTKHVYIYLYHDSQFKLIRTIKLSTEWSPLLFASAEHLGIYRDVLSSLRIELVHIRHVFKHTFDIFQAAVDLEVPIVLSFHDFYLANPFIHLLDTNGAFHPEPNPSPEVDWNVPSGLLEGIPKTSDAILQWKTEISKRLSVCEAFVTTSQVVKDIFIAHYPHLSSSPFHVIEHGRNFQHRETTCETPTPGGQIRVLCLGNTDFHKGSKLIAEIASIDRAKGGRIEFHFMGTVDHYLKDVGVHHGPYDRTNVFQIIKSIRPHFCANLSICCETFSHTLTEAWAAGIPSLATPLGAIGERVARTNGGWVVDINDASSLRETILSIADDTVAYQKIARAIPGIYLKTCTEMAVEYEFVYRDALASHAGLPKPVRLCVFLPEPLTASSYIRTILPLEHPLMERSVSPFFINGTIYIPALHRFIADNNISCIYIHRDAIDPIVFSGLRRLSKTLDIKFLVNMDDDLLSIDCSHPEFAHYQSRLQYLQDLYDAAACVLVSTPSLMSRVNNKRALLFSNALDEETWFSPVMSASKNTSSGHNSLTANAIEVRVLYMGTRTHTPDYELLRPAAEAAAHRLNSMHGIRLRVQLVGVVPATLTLSHPFERIALPNEMTIYPSFVRWLRTHCNWDFAVAPLASNDLNNAKSALKFLDYSALELPGIFSVSQAISNVVKDRENGILCHSNSIEEWTDTIVELATDVSLRTRLATNAHAYVHENALMRTMTTGLSQILRTISSEDSSAASRQVV